MQLRHPKLKPSVADPDDFGPDPDPALNKFSAKFFLDIF
jgi:hypothetical protein